MRAARGVTKGITVLAMAGLLLAACGTTGAGKPAAGDFPTQWLMYAGNPEHNAAFDVPATATKLLKGVQWKFAEANALPLAGPAADQDVLGLRAAPVKTTQFLGNSVGVTAVGGVIYAESDSNYVYAIDAITGKLIWKTPTNNAVMGNPIVAQGVVVVGAGDVGFSFAQVMKYAKHQPVLRGLGFAGIYGMDAKTGKVLWHVATVGEAMPSLAYKAGTVYEGTGDGHVYAWNIKTGAPRWKTRLGGFSSMSSGNLYKNQLLWGFTNPNFVYSIDVATGKVLWKQTVVGVANTGMGDNSPAVDSTKGIVIQDSIVDPKLVNGKPTVDSEVFAMDANAGGKILWQTRLGRGPNPPAYKAGVAMVHGGVIYVGSPATSQFFALDETTGKVLWKFEIPDHGPAGAGRGAGTFAHGTLWISQGPNVFALDPKSGTVLGHVRPGGRFGIVNPVIVGGTMYLGNSWGWIQALPLSSIYKGWQTRA
ncbi:MAG: outer membrane protein assembly factor BamB family protein [Chloroflexota bacterium]